MSKTLTHIDEDGALGRDRDVAHLAVVDRVGRRGLVCDHALVARAGEAVELGLVA